MYSTNAKGERERDGVLERALLTWHLNNHIFVLLFFQWFEKLLNFLVRQVKKTQIETFFFSSSCGFCLSMLQRFCNAVIYVSKRATQARIIELVYATAGIHISLGTI